MLRSLVFTLSVCFAQSAQASVFVVWDPVSNPSIMNPSFKKNFQTLPLKGSVSQREKFWSGDYWPLRNGLINYRWYSKDTKGASPGYSEARAMTIPELAKLSPSEKYDLFTGRYEYPLKKEVAGRADPKAEIWEGICHGWSPASMNHDEPRPKLMTNPDGIEIPFGSSDIKALLSYYYAYVHKFPTTSQVGRRCFKNPPFVIPEPNCEDDLNAGAFHLLLTNRIGLEQRGFIADLQRFKEVWNHPITAYETEVLSKSSPRPETSYDVYQILLLKVKVFYTDGNGYDWRPVLGTPKQKIESTTYTYEVELDHMENIIGGKWISKDRPDFLWQAPKVKSFTGSLARLGELLED